MKTFFVICALCIAGTFAAISEEQKMKLKEYKSACVAETSVSEDAISNLKNGGPVEFDEKMNCFAACMFKKIGIMRADGTIDEDTVRAKVPPNVTEEKVNQMLSSCKFEGKDNCETGGKIMECLLKMKTPNILD